MPMFAANVTALLGLASLDLGTAGIACFALCIVAYLTMVHFREKLEVRKIDQQRRRQRLAHWGYE